MNFRIHTYSNVISRAYSNKNMWLKNTVHNKHFSTSPSNNNSNPSLTTNSKTTPQSPHIKHKPPKKRFVKLSQFTNSIFYKLSSHLSQH